MANIVISLLVKVAVMVLCAIGIANMWVAIFADVGVCMMAVANSVRMLRVKKYQKSFLNIFNLKQKPLMSYIKALTVFALSYCLLFLSV